MALVSLEEAKAYLRVDSSDEDAVVGILLTSAGKLCADVARLTDEQWAAVDADETEDTASYTEEELSRIREVRTDRPICASKVWKYQLTDPVMADRSV